MSAGHVVLPGAISSPSNCERCQALRNHRSRRISRLSLPENGAAATKAAERTFAALIEFEQYGVTHGASPREQRRNPRLPVRGNPAVGNHADFTRVQLEEFRLPPIVAVHQAPSLTRERYEEVVSRLTGGKRRFESPADLPFEGLVVHATAQTEDGFLVFDVFDSQEAVDRFNYAMRTIPREVGIQQPPKFYPAHTFIQQ